jgi:hypothetical protein
MAYDPATFLAITSTSLNLGVSNVGAANRLLRFGKDGFAFIGQAGEKKRN